MTNRSLAVKTETLKETFQLLPDGVERLRYLITLGRQYPVMEQQHRVESNLLSGCISQLWFWPVLRDGTCHFQMGADAMISKGLAALLCSFYTDATPAEIIVTEPDFLTDCGLAGHISASRQTGLSSLRRSIRYFALQQLS